TAHRSSTSPTSKSQNSCFTSLGPIPSTALSQRPARRWCAFVRAAPCRMRYGHSLFGCRLEGRWLAAERIDAACLHLRSEQSRKTSVHSPVRTPGPATDGLRGHTAALPQCPERHLL